MHEKYVFRREQIFIVPQMNHKKEKRLGLNIAYNSYLKYTITDTESQYKAVNC